MQALENICGAMKKQQVNDLLTVCCRLGVMDGSLKMMDGEGNTFNESGHWFLRERHNSWRSSPQHPPCSLEAESFTHLFHWAGILNLYVFKKIKTISDTLMLIHKPLFFNQSIKNVFCEKSLNRS